MTRKEKQLLLKDLCARLPYGVKVKLLCRGPEPKFDDWIEATLNTRDIEHFGKTFKNIKPYLRPMSSMTEEEQEEFVKFHCVNICPMILTDMLTLGNESKMFDWLNANHFDYRGLIPMGLALEATEGIYN